MKEIGAEAFRSWSSTSMRMTFLRFGQSPIRQRQDARSLKQLRRLEIDTPLTTNPLAKKSTKANLQSRQIGDNLSKTQYQHATDLSRLNWRGWVLLMLCISAMLATIIGGTMYAQSAAPGDRGARKLIGYVSAFFIFGIFILIAAGLHWLGYSIYKDGLHPFHQIDSDPAPSTIQEHTATKSTAPGTTSVSFENDD